MSGLLDDYAMLWHAMVCGVFRLLSWCVVVLVSCFVDCWFGVICFVCLLWCPVDLWICWYWFTLWVGFGWWRGGWVLRDLPYCLLGRAFVV